MFKLFRHISKVGVIALIFFSLQGEVILRYAQMFKPKSERKERVKNIDERQRLIKLQCYTQRFDVIGLPPNLKFDFVPAVIIKSPSRYRNFTEKRANLNNLNALQLRGPPAFTA